ncbi:MAG: hypothetical protein VB084_15135 [Syntrophomonadaceae bacterium]|nr:hypothetical protein [Syntrophomonadaceae bacterium]
MLNHYIQKTDKVMDSIKADPVLSQWVDLTLKCPAPYTGSEDIKLIVLGQDPTIKNADKRKDIKKVLNLDSKKQLRTYINNICSALGMSLENVYATNLVKNFFLEPPAKNISLLRSFETIWSDVLNWELIHFPDVPIISFGEPVVQCIVQNGSQKVRDYWGYQGQAKPTKFSRIEPHQNKLGRRIYPFPHQPSAYRKPFYKNNLDSYLGYVLAQKHQI